MNDKLTIELLCEMLEEHGLSCHTHYLHAFWWVGPKLYEAADNLDGTLTVGRLTLEQAIAATLGSGTCENLSSMNVDGVAGYHFICSECGLSVCASMGIGEIEPSGSRSFRWKVDGRYEFERCPRCGKAVKR